jgi:hypothetical protein
VRMAKKANKPTKRRYTDRTLKLLWGRAAGRCAMPECRVELYAEATDYDPIVVIGEIAHVAAAGAAGPRAALSMSDADKNAYDNLMLLCQNCHGRVDGQPSFHSVTRLLDMKQAHEAWVRASLPERGRSRTGWSALVLRGDHPLDMATIEAALSPDFAIAAPQVLSVSMNSDWPVADKKIAAAARALLAGDDAFDKRIAVFPIAPVSACLALGYHLTSRPHVRLFQHHRDEQSWVWPRRALPPDDIILNGLDGDSRDADAVTIAFHFSATVSDEALVEAGAPLTCRINIGIESPSTMWLQHPEQMTRAVSTTRRAFEAGMRLYPRARRWHLFYAGPAPLAVAIGQQINPTMYPAVQLYEYRHKELPRYRPSILLGATQLTPCADT